MLDVRAPIEWLQGHVAHAHNIPLLNDSERTQVGIVYKQQGQDAAIALGHKLVSGHTKEQRLLLWIEFCEHHPQGQLLCFRGGLRSKTVQSWLFACGVDYALVDGGYKALRQFLLHQGPAIVAQQNIIVLAGQTGCGKTQLLHQLPHALDLEGLAQHKGSAFGGLLQQQPGQATFENKVYGQLLKHHHGHHRQALWCEDESRIIGHITVPQALYQQLKQAPVVILDTPLQQRTHTILSDYIQTPLATLTQAAHNDPIGYLHQYFVQALIRIKKRLGHRHFDKIHQQLQHSFHAYTQGASVDIHHSWIQSLLVEYYDPMYQYQLKHKQERVIFQGGFDDVLDFALTFNDATAPY